jgi:hypothetical protein
MSTSELLGVGLDEAHSSPAGVFAHRREAPNAAGDREAAEAFIAMAYSAAGVRFDDVTEL